MFSYIWYVPCDLQLRNEFSVCRVYISTGTLRSFDRRPLNPPGGLAAVQYCGYQQQQLQPRLPPAAAVPTTTSHHHQQMLAAAVVDDAAADNNNGRQHAAAAAAENSHDSSSSGSRGGGGVDGADQDAATGIDWDSLSLIPPVDDLAGFAGVDDLTRVIWPHN